VLDLVTEHLRALCAVARFTGSTLMSVWILGFRFAPPQALRCRPLRGPGGGQLSDSFRNVAGRELSRIESFGLGSFDSGTVVCHSGARRGVLLLLAGSVWPLSSRSRPRWLPLVALVAVEFVLIVVAVAFQLRTSWLYQVAYAGTM